MVGWVREPSAAEKEVIAPPFRDLPVTGRLTGRGNTANIEMVLAVKPDLILDVGSVDPTYASLADRVQEQTGIPYLLVDGSFARTPRRCARSARFSMCPRPPGNRRPSPKPRSPASPPALPRSRDGAAAGLLWPRS